MVKSGLKAAVSMIITVVLIFLFFIGSVYAYNTGYRNQTNPDGKGKPDEFIIREVLGETTWADVEPCSKYLDENKLWKEAISCAAGTFDSEDYLELRRSEPPKCWVIKRTSNMIYNHGDFNYLAILRRNLMSVTMAVLGVYIPELNSQFLVENVDLEDIYRHETQHHMFRLLKKENLDSGSKTHTHKIWEKCEPTLYKPSKNSIKINSKRKLTKDDILMKEKIKSDLIQRHLIIKSIGVKVKIIG